VSKTAEKHFKLKEKGFHGIDQVDGKMNSKCIKETD